MNLNKQDFKKAYSEYRKQLHESFNASKSQFSKAFNSDSIFRDIKVGRTPVSTKIWCHFYDKGNFTMCDKIKQSYE